METKIKTYFLENYSGDSSLSGIPGGADFLRVFYFDGEKIPSFIRGFKYPENGNAPDELIFEFSEDKPNNLERSLLLIEKYGTEVKI